MSGSIVEWVEAIGTWASAALAVPAIWLAIRADRSAKDSARKAEELDRQRLKMQREQDERLREYEAKRQTMAEEQRQADMQRERRELAGQLQVWWVFGGKQTLSGEYTDWGFIVQNRGISPCVYRSLLIKHSSSRGSNTTRIEAVPPGTYFVRNNGDFLGTLTTLADPTVYTPVSSSKNYTIDELQYIDALGNHWRWTPSEGLQLVGSSL